MNFKSILCMSRGCSLLLALWLGLTATLQAQTLIGDPVNGGTLYNASQSCKSCHDAPPTKTDGSRVYLGVSWTVVKAAFTKFPADMGKFAAGGSKVLTDAQVKDVTAYICQSIASTASTCYAAVATPPAAAISPTSLSAFPSTKVGVSSAATVVTLSNTGGTALAISSIAISGLSASDFSQTNNCGSSLAATTGSCSINISFSPTAIGARTASLTITHNNNNVAGSTSVLNLTGTGLAASAPVIALDKTSLVFSSVTVGKISAGQEILLTNSGNAALALPANPLSLTGANAADFATTHNCPSSLAVLSSCRITATFSPLSVGAGKVATLNIANNSNLPVQTVALSGAAQNPTPVLTSNTIALAFGTQLVNSSTSLGLLLSSSGTGPVSFSPTLASFSAAGFTSTHNCPSSLAIGAQCNLTVTYAPVAAGASNAVLSINSDYASPVQVNVSGTAQLANASAGKISLTPSTGLNFGTQIMLTNSALQTLSVSNVGSGTLSVSAITISGLQAGDYSLATGTGACATSFALPAASSCSVYVRFTPKAAGASAAVLTVTSDSVGGVGSINLLGTGSAVSAPIASVGASAVYFAGVVGSAGAAQTITLSNAGNANLTGSYSLSGAQAGEFTVLSDVGSCSSLVYTVAPGTSCNVYVRYTPSALGGSSATLVFNTNASVQQVRLNGTAGAVPVAIPNLSGAGNWPSLQVNVDSASKTFVLTNSGNAALSITSSQITGAAASDFTLSHNCPASLAAGASCNFTIVFKPSQVGARDAALNVTTNASTSAMQIALSGTGSAAPVAVDSTTTTPGSGNASGASTSPAATTNSPTQVGKSGGCTAGDTSNPFDPMLWLLVLVSMGLLWRKRQSKARA